MGLFDVGGTMSVLKGLGVVALLAAVAVGAFVVGTVVVLAIVDRWG